MNESEIRSKLPLYADGELPPADRAEVEAYLQRDAGARDEVAAWHKLREAVGRVVGVEPVPAGLHQRVQTHLRGLRIVQRPRVFRLGISGLAAAAVLVMAFFLWPEGTPASAASGAPASFFMNQHQTAAYVEHPDDLGVREGQSWEEFTRSKCGGCCKRLSARTSFRCAIPDLSSAGYQLHGGTEFRLRDHRVVQAYFRCADASGGMFSVFIVNGELQLVAREGAQVITQHGATRDYEVGRDGKFTLVSFVMNGQTYLLCCGRATAGELIAMADQMQPETLKPGCRIGG